MSKKQRRKIKPSAPKKIELLDATSSEQIKYRKKSNADLLEYWYQHYSSLAFQRAKIQNELCDAVSIKCTQGFEFQDWVRVVRYRWSLKPLSSAGSIINEGGRFNIGDIDQIKFPKFPALYIAENNEIALRETFGPKDTKELRNFDYALSAPSFSLVRLRGKIETVFDLSKIENLREYFQLIRGIEFPAEVLALARSVGEAQPRTVTELKDLKKSLLEENWRYYPILCETPSNSQIFGQIAHAAGIHGILFPSTKGNANCLVVFPSNFEGSSSYVELCDETPVGSIVKRLDSSTWRNLI